MMPRLSLTSRMAWCGAVVLALGLSACSSDSGAHGPGSQATTTTSPGSGASSTTSPSSTASTPGGGFTSDAQSSPLGAHWDMSRLGSFEPYLGSMRGSATYNEVVWCKIEKSQGNRNWRPVDEIADAAQKYGITLDLKIRVGACWATGGSGKIVRGSADKTESAMPKDLGAYTDFVRELAERYKAKGVHTYAIENEVNSASFWDGSPQDYIKLTEIAAKELRSVDPQARIADAGMSSTSYGYGLSDRLLSAGKGQEAISAFNAYFERRIGTRGEAIPKVSSVDQLRTVLASEQGQRNLAFLAAARTLAERKVTDIRQIHFYEPSAGAPLMLDFVKSQTPSDTPIEAWEVGSFWKGADGTATSRAQDMVRTVASLLAGGVRRVMWLPLATAADNRRGQEIRYGLLDPDGTIRPAGVAMSEMVAASRGARVVPLSTGTLQGVSFEREGVSTLVAWSTKGDVQLVVGTKAHGAQVGAALAPIAGPTVKIGAAAQLIQTSLPLQQVLAEGK